MKAPPSRFLRILQEAGSATSSESKQRHLLTLGENLIIHLSSFVLAEYRESHLTFLKVEKEFISQKKSISIGVYTGWIRDTANFLKQQHKSSVVNRLLTQDAEHPEMALFITRLNVFKKVLDSSGLPPSYDACMEASRGHSKKNCTLIDFLHAFVQLRNKVAHPVYEVNGKTITWPFNDDYYHFILPSLESAMVNTMEVLLDVWEFGLFTVAECIDENAVLTDAGGSGMVSVIRRNDWFDGMSVLLDSGGRILVNDWKVILRPHPEAEAAIRQEQEQLRKISSISELKEHITDFLGDGQITVEEYRLLESISRAKLNMPEDELRSLVMSVAAQMGIESPFPEVDNRFIEAIDRTIREKSYNSLVLRLLGEQYGVKTDDLEALVDSRATLLGVSPEEARTTDYIQFEKEELRQYQSLVIARQWLMGMSMLNTGGAENFKLTGQSSNTTTKEYWHKFAFKSVESFVRHRLSRLGTEENGAWEIKMNQWQIGNMTSYAWCSFYPKSAITKSALALHLSLYGSGNAAIGFLPDWKALDEVEHYGKLLYHARKGLQRYFLKYLAEFKKYKDLVIWNHLLNDAFCSVSEAADTYPWYIETDYQFEQIQFFQKAGQGIEHPHRLTEFFDIAFNLFNNLIPEIEQEYTAALNEEPDPLAQYADLITGICESMQALLAKYVDEPAHLELRKDMKKSRPGLRLSVKEDGYPMQLEVVFSADYNRGLIYCDFAIRYAHDRSTIHQRIGEMLETFSPGLKEFNRLHRPGTLLFRYTTSDPSCLEFIVTEAFGIFITELTLGLARWSLQVMGLKPVLHRFDSIQNEVGASLDALAGLVQPQLVNSIKKERNLRVGLRFIDYVDSSRKHGMHWLGYGLQSMGGDRYEWVLMAHLNNVQAGPVLADMLERYVQSHPDFHITYGGEEGLRQSACWMLESASDQQLTASSHFNRNHAPRFSRLHSEPRYANWSAAVCRPGEWIQIDLGEPYTLWSVAVQGRFNRDQWVECFDVLVSSNGKDWIVANKDVKGPSSRNEVITVEFEKPYTARFTRIVAQSWYGWISMRFDVLAGPALPRNLRLTRTWPYPQTSAEVFQQELLQALQEMKTKLGKEFLFKQ